jgi:hypothetical protein
MSLLREFCTNVVPQLMKVNIPKPDDADDAQDGKHKTEDDKQKTESADEKKDVMKRLAALVGPYKKAVADNGPDAQRLHALFAKIKSAVDTQQFAEAAKDLDTLELALYEQPSSQPDVDDDDEDEDDDQRHKKHHHHHHHVEDDDDESHKKHHHHHHVEDDDGDPKPQPAFNPPPGAHEPTLRKGDNSKDGWVEYLQQLLNVAMNTHLPIDGNFSPETLKTVIAFQQKKQLQVDGIVGNQTWAALRGGKAEPPSTDGRKPHSFEETGGQARWFKEHDICAFFQSADQAKLVVVSVGERAIDHFKATVRVTRPKTPPKVVEIKIGPPVARMPDNQGNKHHIVLDKFREKFMAGDPDEALADYLVEAYLPNELGGDVCTGKINLL